MKMFSLFPFLAATALAIGLAASSPILAPRNLCPVNKEQPDLKPASNGVSGAYQHISAKHPEQVFPGSDWAKVTPNDVCAIFNLRVSVPASQGKICNTMFEFPDWHQAPDLFKFSGSGNFTLTSYKPGFGSLEGVTTYYNQPPFSIKYFRMPYVMKPGNSYLIRSEPCNIAPGIPSPSWVAGSLCSSDTEFIFKQSNLLCPLGFYMVLTDI
ncbi:hypothetical protein CC80DRAFT_490967 [Byssothecium circinans]|uniref:Ubiquitin 3 binding protein But2 C-terminal domain-containing protein n=1 Tax=Byssothecium circinans TaxID=147558 RepID=A0A6A5U0J0_9PLEO|nr:hypothetical protein CC80DRAFT_490967 [Byssothecium circinans]